MKEVKPKTGISCGHALQEHELWLSQFGGQRQFKDFQSYSEAEPRTGPDLVTTDGRGTGSEGKTEVGQHVALST